jgi:hypothetical protein
VYFGFGSIRAHQDLSQVFIQSARALGRRAIVSRGWAELPVVHHQPDCIVIDEVNQQKLFGRVAAVDDGSDVAVQNLTRLQFFLGPDRKRCCQEDL